MEMEKYIFLKWSSFSSRLWMLSSGCNPQIKTSMFMECVHVVAIGYDIDVVMVACLLLWLRSGNAVREHCHRAFIHIYICIYN